ncbi:MAG: hypothetical protein GTO62_13070, partial [Planctomycetales bacterium]|nr:hypothetical protein [Planctomycetales bacterium]
MLRTDAETNQEARERAEMLKAGDELKLDKIFDGEAAHTDDEFTIEELERER